MDKPQILIITDFSGVHATKQNSIFSYSEHELLFNMLSQAGIDPYSVEYKSILPFMPPGGKIDSVWTTVKKDATSAGIVDNHFAGAYFHSQILGYLKKFQENLTKRAPCILVPVTEMALWTLTDKVSLSQFRGSEEKTIFESHHIVVPTYSPKQLFKMFEWRYYVWKDFQRIGRIQQEGLPLKRKEQTLHIRPTFAEVKDVLELLINQKELIQLSVDIETIRRHISCIGFAPSAEYALCIPFIKEQAQSYFTLEQHIQVIKWLKLVLQRHLIIGQNFSYDTHHIARHWGFLEHSSLDTMLMAHVLYPGMKKDLATLASLHNERYTYWKDEHTDFNNLPEDLNQDWLYNAKDCINTFELAQHLKQEVKEKQLTRQWQFLQRTQKTVDRMMLRGIRINRYEKNSLEFTLTPALAKRQKRLNFMCDTELNINSPKQLQKFFYSDLKIKSVISRKTGRVSTDDECLKEIARQEPLMQPITTLIKEMRSIKVFISTFVKMPLDTDGRMRTSFNVGGTETFRFSSSKNPFGSGGNLQNIPKGQEEEDLEGFKLPNLRRMFIPDAGYTLFDVDLAGADAQIVAWEAEDDDLKAKFRSGEKIHALNAKDMYGNDAGPDGKKQPYYKKAKMGTHLSNYGGTARTLSIACAMTVHEAEKFQKRWFEMHPGIKKIWHARVQECLHTDGVIYNQFGFRKVYYNRPERAFTEALAWIPQSTVALIINRALNRMEEYRNEIAVMLQVHDSIVGQLPKVKKQTLIPLLLKALQVTVPYDDPLIIGTSLDISEKSWGDLISCKWKDYTL